MRWLLAAPAPPGTIQPEPFPGTGGPGETELRQLPPPVAGKTVNVSVRAGRVFVRIPPSRRFVELTDARQIPVGATLDTRRGRVNLLSAADRKGATQLAWFYDGVFKVGQTRRLATDHEPHDGRADRALPALRPRELVPGAQEDAQAVGRGPGHASARPAGSARRRSAAPAGS